jgi:hypothetical protein
MSRKAKILIFTLYMLLMLSVIVNILTVGNPTDHEISIRIAVITSVNLVVMVTSLALRARKNKGATERLGAVAGVSDGR